MKPDENTQRIKPVEDHDESPNIEREHESEAAEVQEPQPTGWAAQLRQLMHGSAQGEARTNIKRQQLREDRTKSFLLLAGLTVVLALAFFVMFSTPSTGRKDVARTNQPNLGRGSGGENTDTSHSVTPLLNADTRNPDDNAGNLSAQDIRNTARQRMLAQASPSFGDAPVPPPPAPRPEPKDYALNRIQFPPEQPQITTPTPAPEDREIDKSLAGVREFRIRTAGDPADFEQRAIGGDRTEPGIYGAADRDSVDRPAANPGELGCQDARGSCHRVQL